MIEVLSDVAHFLITIPVFGFFTHIVAFLLLIPVAYFLWSPAKKLKRWFVLIIGTPVYWFIFIYGSQTISQYFYDITGLGILLGALLSTLAIMISIKNEFFEKNTWIAYLMMFTLPTIGYFTALFFNY